MLDVAGEIIGYLAGICTAIVFLPQSIRTIKTKDVRGLSLSSYVIYCLGVLSWIVYGVYLHSIQMMFFNTVSLLFTAVILYMIIVQRMKK
jgi:MtN3 and saliva related transmembrane protein